MNFKKERISRLIFQILILVILIFNDSCALIEKTSSHGFNSGYYRLINGKTESKQVYVDIHEDVMDVYPKKENGLDPSIMTINMQYRDSFCIEPYIFKKTSLDIDITTILFKFRPGVTGLPAQMNVDFNGALYAGWRRDNYHLNCEKNPLGNCHFEIVNRGYDFGVFGGPGTTLISPFSTNGHYGDEYTGMIIQFGIAGFLESEVASFGIAMGYDYLLSPQRSIWIYNKKPWIGITIGTALN